MSSSTDDLGSASRTAPALRVASPADAAALLRLKQRLDEETSFMLLEVDERDPSAEHLARHLEDVARADSSVVIVAEVRSGLVGYVELIGGPVRRNRPTAQLVIGVLAEASGQGVGSGLLREARAWAAQHGLHRVELTVMAHNHRARSLYERMGFVLEGRRAECLFVEGGSSTSCIWPCSCPVLPGAKATANLERITIE